MKPWTRVSSSSFVPRPIWAPAVGCDSFGILSKNCFSSLMAIWSFVLVSYRTSVVMTTVRTTSTREIPAIPPTGYGPPRAFS